METKQQLDILIDFGKEINRKNDIDMLLQTMADFAKELVNADRCSIFVFDEDNEELWTRVAHGIVDEIRISAQKGIAGAAALTKQTQLIDDAYKDKRFNQDIDKKTGYRTKTIMAEPLLDHYGNTLGVFQVLNKKSGLFTQNDAQLLQIISNYASAALENALLALKIKDNQHKIISKLSTAAEFKDTETSNHTKRVGAYSALIAEKIGLPKEEVDLIRETAPMHDAGKIGISDSILLKPDKLTDKEFDKMKTHTQIGYNLLQDEESEFLQAAAIIALEHHEKYNGKGYPNRKSGEDIDLYARIVAIADVFDALTTERPYKKAWSNEKTMSLLQEERGQHFDPKLVDIFINNFDDVLLIQQKYRDNLIYEL
jgi:response regulator RpfG family c-di-GMP phosphodiesterase